MNDRRFLNSPSTPANDLLQNHNLFNLRDDFLNNNQLNTDFNLTDRKRSNEIDKSADKPKTKRRRKKTAASPLEEEDNAARQSCFVQNQVFVFSSKLANQAAEAVRTCRYANIIDYHRSLPATSRVLSCLDSRNGEPLTQEQLRKRHENLAKLQGIGELLNVYPIPAAPRPSMSPRCRMPMMGYAEGDITSAQMDWQRLQAEFYEKRAKEEMIVRSYHGGPMRRLMLMKAGQPERFGSAVDFLRKTGPMMGNCELQMCPSPKQMNYEIDGQELVITKQLNPRAASELAPPLNSMLEMTNNIPQPNSATPSVSPASRDPTRSTPYDPRFDSSRQFDCPKSRSSFYGDSVEYNGVPEQNCQVVHHPGAVNNTYVNATMSIQQLNIQSIPPHQTFYQPFDDRQVIVMRPRMMRPRFEHYARPECYPRPRQPYTPRPVMMFQQYPTRPPQYVEHYEEHPEYGLMDPVSARLAEAGVVFNNDPLLESLVSSNERKYEDQHIVAGKHLDRST